MNDHILVLPVSIFCFVRQGETPAQKPLPVGENENRPEYNVCHLCGGKVFVNLKDWNGEITLQPTEKPVAGIVLHA